MLRLTLCGSSPIALLFRNLEKEAEAVLTGWKAS
jgi:hypothetical protein